MNRFYDRQINPDMQRRIKKHLSTEELRELHARRPALHFLVVLQQTVLLVGLGLLAARFATPWVWVPAGILQGFVVLSFIILLHEQVHNAIFTRRRPFLERLLGLYYALPSSISASQFKRWHLDHHSELGTENDDPKRAYLSPKRNARWYKALYMTVGLFVIYSIASARAAKAYAPSLKRLMITERLINTALHVALAVFLWRAGGPELWFRVHGFPMLVTFPFAFTLNRLGQHYMQDPTDPAKWSTLVPSHWFLDWLFLWSNLHLEHHYLVGVPFYHLPALQTKLKPFYAEIGLRPMGYGEILYRWFVRNQAPHTNWLEGEQAPETVAAPVRS